MKNLLVKTLSIMLMSLFCGVHVFSQEPNGQVKKVFLIFKTHLDIGYTELSSVVERKYVEEFIPKTLDIIDKLKAEAGGERYVWTTGSWLIASYLQNATPEAVKRLEAAIRNNEIVWNALPYTVESELMSRELFETCLKLSKELDQKYGKMTIAGKMTDVPGHTRGIVTPLHDAGISLLHIGVNGASAVPEVPPIFRWKNTDGKEIVMMYQGSYGDEMLLPDGETVVQICFTGDNIGAHSLEQIKQIFAYAKNKYPDAVIKATSLNEVASEIQKMTDKLPVVTSEIGDTWIYGFGTSPLRIARFRALQRLYSQWVKAGKIDINSPSTIDFAIRLGLIAEHTWGLDVKTHLKNWDKWDFDIFSQSRSLPEFKKIERSWAEVDENIDKAIALLPQALQKEALETLENIGKVNVLPAGSLKTTQSISKLNAQLKKVSGSPVIEANGACSLQLGGVNMLLGEMAYQTCSTEDYINYRAAYTRSNYDWALGDFGKPGLENSKAQSAAFVTQNAKKYRFEKSGGNVKIQCELQFTTDNAIHQATNQAINQATNPSINQATNQAINPAINPKVLPESTRIEYLIPASGNRIEMNVSFINKPANRLPEVYYLSFFPQGIQKILAEKTGFPVDVMDVVAGGNRQFHAIDNYIDIITDKGTVRITSLDAPIAVFGERKMLNYSTQLPDLNKGVHFCLFNNLWGTNFTMWWEGSITFRFIIEVY